MVLMLTLYLTTVYLIFVKWRLLPFNKITGTIVVVLGVVIVNILLAGLQTLTPPSVQATLSAQVTEIVSQVRGRVIEVPVAVDQAVEPSQVLFRVDPQPFQAEVDRLKALLVEAESGVAQLRESYDAARAGTRATRAQLVLSEHRLEQHRELYAARAGSQFDVEKYETEVATLTDQLAANVAQENQAQLALSATVGNEQSQVAQVLAQFDAAQFDLDSCEVRAPAAGIVTMNMVRPGMMAPRLSAVMAFVHTDSVLVAGLFQQKALGKIEVGDEVSMSFPALPGRLFHGTVREIPTAIGNAQFLASGKLEVVDANRMTRLYPVLIDLPEDFPDEQVRLGLAADARIYSKQAGVVGIVATILQWITTSMDYVA